VEEGSELLGLRFADGTLAVEDLGSRMKKWRVALRVIQGKRVTSGK